MPRNGARRVFVLTGKRGGFGAMLPMLKQISEDPELELQLVATDQHLNKEFGRTVSEIEKWFSLAAAVDLGQEGDSPAHRSRALGVCLTRMTDAIAGLDPDVVMLYGDRGEVLSTAIAALNLGKPIFHLQGGDVTGNLDEPMRHAITKLAHVHFASTPQSADRIRGLGEQPWRIHVVGDLHVDPIIQKRWAHEEEVRSTFRLVPGQPVLVVLQHPVTTEPHESYEQMTETMAAVAATGHSTIVIYPCSDQGYGGIVRAIGEHTHLPGIQVHKNIPAPVFLGLLRAASVLIGNSSAGLIESPYFPIPAINIGSRQKGRLHAENVLHVPHEREAIGRAIDVALHDSDFLGKVGRCSRPFGDGRSGERVVEALKKTPLDKSLIEKEMTF